MISPANNLRLFCLARLIIFLRDRRFSMHLFCTFLHHFVFIHFDVICGVFFTDLQRRSLKMNTQRMPFRLLRRSFYAIVAQKRLRKNITPMSASVRTLSCWRKVFPAVFNIVFSCVFAVRPILGFGRK